MESSSKEILICDKSSLNAFESYRLATEIAAKQDRCDSTGGFKIGQQVMDQCNNFMISA